MVTNVLCVVVVLTDVEDSECPPLCVPPEPPLPVTELLLPDPPLPVPPLPVPEPLLPDPELPDPLPPEAIVPAGGVWVVAGPG